MKVFRTLLLLVVVAALGALGAQWLGDERLRDMGDVIVRVGGFDYIATLPQAILVTLIVLIIAGLLWSLISAPFRVWGRYRRNQGRARLVEGLQAYEAGQWQRSEKSLLAAAEDPEVAGVALCTAVRSARAREDEAATRQYLNQLAGIDATAHALLQAESLLVEERPVDAINVLDAAAIQPLPPRGLWLRTEALARAERAQEAYGQLGALRKQKVLPEGATSDLEARLAAQSLLEASDVNALAAQWEATPKALRHDSDVVAAYALRATALRWDEPALLQLETTLDHRWDETLVALYGHLPVDRLATRQANLQRWLTQHPASPSLLLALGRVARRQEQYALAEEYLHRAVAEGAGADAWEELGMSFADRGETALAQQCFSNALRLQRGETAVELARGEFAAGTIGAGTPGGGLPRATVEEQVQHPVPPVVDGPVVREPVVGDPVARDPLVRDPAVHDRVVPVTRAPSVQDTVDDTTLREERDSNGNPRFPPV